MNKTQFLQDILDQTIPGTENYDSRNKEMYEFFAKYIPKKGWYAIPVTLRWFDDEGEYLGKDIKESLATLKCLGFSVPKYEKKET